MTQPTSQPLPSVPVAPGQAPFVVPAKVEAPRFTFVIGETELSVISANKLQADTLVRMLDGEGGAIAAFLDLFDGDDRALVSTLDMDQMMPLIEAWQGWSGVNPGESEASGS